MKKDFATGEAMNTKKLEIVQVMRAFACVSIFLYHLPVTWGGKE